MEDYGAGYSGRECCRGMAMIKEQRFVLILLAVILLLTACGDGEEIAQEIDLESMQRADETVLVDLGRTYVHSVPAGFYMEYALNDAGDQALPILVTPAGDEDLAVVVVRADDQAVAVLEMKGLAAGETNRALFIPEAGVNYLLRVYGLSGNILEYELAFAP